MRRLIFGLVLLAALIFIAVAAGSTHAARATQAVNVFVVVPSSYVSTVTPSQAFTAMTTWLGQPTDAPCLGPSCTIEGYFRSQVGKVFDYELSIVSRPVATVATDACGQGADNYWWWAPTPIVDNRTFTLVLGGGGWAGHNPGDRKSGAFGMIGDWGVQSMFGVPVACNPGYWTGFMDRGMAHEFEGMMGAFRNGATYDYFCCERPYEATHRKNVLQWSRAWLRDP